MSQNPAFMQLYVGDYLADTLHLTTEQHGAYLLLLMTMWRNGAELPNDHQKLARIARVTPKRWGQIWAEIGGFFEVDGTVVRQPRLSKEFQKAVSISQERKTAGKIGGKANALKKQEAAQANASDLLKHAGANPYPDTIKKEEEQDASAKIANSEPENPPTSWTPDRLWEAVTQAVGLKSGRLPTHWLPPAATIHAWRWVTDLKLTPEAIVDAARTSRQQHPEPPNGLKALDVVMSRLAAAIQAPPPEAVPTTFRPIGAASPKRLWTLDPDDFDDEGNRIHDRFAQG